MEIRDLSNIPDIALPEGYTMRAYRDGDEEGLARIYAVSRLDKDTPAIVRADIMTEPCFTPERLFVVEYDGEIVGTASAWVTAQEPEAGYLHMLGVLEHHRGKGIGAALTCAAMKYSRDEGFTIQRLLTDDWREAAIRLYLDLGFDPLVSDRSHPARWATLSKRLRRPEALTRMRRMESGRPEAFLARLRRMLGFATL
ncbi:MAG TPA: GNAT family N-acetyltransferase [Candidatus Hydrogenedentes bacterium]|nr:GNAT family N-acetyltransferase [Candidatus Hydrogenedentota bacterium]